MTAAQNLENVQLLLENPKEVLHLHQLLVFGFCDFKSDVNNIYFKVVFSKCSV